MAGELAGQLCEAGLDFIKDDELMANPPHSPFDERVDAIMRVINEHADRTGKKVMYAFNISDELDPMQRHYDKLDRDVRRGRRATRPRRRERLALGRVPRPVVTLAAAAAVARDATVAADAGRARLAAFRARRHRRTVHALGESSTHASRVLTRRRACARRDRTGAR